MLAAASGCPKTPTPAPTAEGPLLQRLAAHAERVDSVRADVKIEMELSDDVDVPGAQRKGKFSGILTAASESRLRIEVFSPLGPVAYIMALSGRIVTAIVPFSGEYARADVTDDAIAGPLAALPVSIQELPELARGVIPLREGSRKEIEDEQGRGVLLIEDPDAESEIQRVVFDSEGGWPVEAHYAGAKTDGTVDTVVIHFQEYVSVDDSRGDSVALPTQIRVEAGSKGNAAMTLKNIELNPELPEDLFEIVLPTTRTPAPDSGDF